MIVIHAGLFDKRFHLWGEVPSETESPSRRKGRKSKAAKPASSPFDADAGALTSALSEVTFARAPKKKAFDSQTLWLPTVRDQPVASSALVQEPPDSLRGLKLAPWTVTVLPLSTDQAVDLLAHCLDRSLLAHGVHIGTSLRYWANVARFAAGLVARERFLPDLVQEPDGWHARWRPVIHAEDGQRLDTLAQHMPPVCRALGKADEPPQRSARTLLRHALQSLVDRFVRSTSVESTPRKTKRKVESLHDVWVQALRSPESLLDSKEKETRELADQVRTWCQPIALSEAPFRLCFRLEEPPESKKRSTDWTVHFLLQDQADPSTLIPLEKAWKPGKKQASLFERRHYKPREHVLAALGQAVGLYPSLESSLKSATPTEHPIDSNGAHQFLTESAWLLQQAGFGVLLPSWWTGKGSKKRLTVRAKSTGSPSLQGGSGLTLEQLIKFDWQVALGEETLTAKELADLAALKSPLVKLRGEWVHVSAEELQAALDFWKKQSSGEMALRDLVRMTLGAESPPGELAFGGLEADGWVGDFLDQLKGNASFEELPQPEHFEGTLRPYQIRGFSWMSFLHQWGLGACLADDMGLGKTIQTLALLQHDRELKLKKPTLLICPMSVVGNWAKEADKFTPDLPVLIHHGQERQKGAKFAREAKKHTLVISSYSLLHRDAATLQKVKWGGVILDEAQNIKNPKTKQAKAACALQADYRIALTGTPVENHIGDLWSIWQFLNPGFLGTQADFRRRFFIPIQFRDDPQAVEDLQRLTEPFLLRRVKTDKSILSDLPDKMEMKVFCNLTREQTSLYEAVVENLAKDLSDAEGIKRKGIILGTLSKLKQVCNHPAQFLGDNSAIAGRSGKLARLTEMIDEVLQAGEKALIFTQFTEMGDIILKHLQETFGCEVLFLHGAISRKKRDAMVKRFQEGKDAPLFLLSLKAGGTGLNLTAANHVFHFDRWWNPAVENQATDRAFRIGQTRNVQVHKFVCVGTLEEKIDEMIEKKQSVAAKVVGTGEAWLTKLSNEELTSVFALREEALGE